MLGCAIPLEAWCLGTESLFISFLLRVSCCSVSAQTPLPWSVAWAVRCERANMQIDLVPNLGSQFLLKHQEILKFPCPLIQVISNSHSGSIAFTGATGGCGTSVSSNLWGTLLGLTPSFDSSFCCCWKSALTLINLTFYCIHIYSLFLDKYTVIFSSIVRSFCFLCPVLWRAKFKILMTSVVLFSLDVAGSPYKISFQILRL